MCSLRVNKPYGSVREIERRGRELRQVRFVGKD